MEKRFSPFLHAKLNTYMEILEYIEELGSIQNHRFLAHLENIEM